MDSLLSAPIIPLPRIKLSYDYDYIEKHEDKLITIFNDLDINIIGFSVQKNGNIKNLHVKKKQPFGNEVFLPFELESSGTQKLLWIICEFLKGMSNDAIFFVDELDANLHTKILRYIVTMFKKSNSNAQLFYNSHDIDTLDADLFRKDEVYFAALNEMYFTDIVSLADFGTDVRGDNSFAKKYREGKIGYDPYINYGMEWINGK